ncbi:RagB/SusD family nutrient uptake outer membrane protein [Rufibacter latericius]|uniref:RagB/SusD family nutrient uptake outer membrane protein n=1 Tax=Rufibacter latericius TaxID=2487040 RepID=A0A3M9M8C2_9BACT|nr:RagB/SusD family nutrient uptake outer membrane protein [Rufibacter latericius]RNI21840.1 RagB/SusD family nutrient uptake outer membrane protein [Rufibacter latericius]
MKTILTSYKTFVLAAAVLFSSCDLLEPDPATEVLSSTALVDARGAQAALLGTYSELQSNSYYGLDYPALSYLSSDEAESIGSFDFYRQFDRNGIQSENSSILSTWRQIYRVINLANNLIADVPAIQDPALTDNLRKSILAEAHFLRGLAYFDIARAWGGAQLVLTPTDSKLDGQGIGRSTKAETYAQVLSDLNQAEQFFTEVENGAVGASYTTPARASLLAVWALKARFYLYQENWTEAENYATKVIEVKKAQLVFPYEQTIQGLLTPESILELAYTTANGNSHASYWLPSSSGGRLEWIPGQTITSELRNPAVGGARSILIGTSGAIVYGKKYFRNGTSDDPAFLLRISEQYLIRAEARVKKAAPDLAGALADVNAIRERARLEKLTLTDAPGLLLAIEQERKLELAFEGHRWFDLIRTGRAQAVLGITDPNKFLYPIPNADIVADPDLGPEDQNPGY